MKHTLMIAMLLLCAGCGSGPFGTYPGPEKVVEVTAYCKEHGMGVSVSYVNNRIYELNCDPTKEIGK